MKKIGLLGEDPNDTAAVKNLLLQKYNASLQFKHLLKNRRGHQLDNLRTFEALRIEFDDYNPDLVIFIRDVDGIVTEHRKVQKVSDWFTKLNAAVNKRGILLMNIYELEALILADIEAFNKAYNVNIKFNGDVEYQTKPKEFLKDKTSKLKKRYEESHCPEIFKNLNFDIVEKKSKAFAKFHKELKLRV